MFKRLEQNTTDQLWNSQQAADYLGICTRTLFTLAKEKGEIPRVNIGERVLYDPKDVRQFAEDKKNISPNEKCNN